MTTFKNGRTAMGDNPGDSMTTNATSFGGRGAMPAGKLKRYPGAVGDVSGGNRRKGKVSHGDGGGSGTTFKTHTAFRNGKK
jgi:hypothetical protein